MNKDNIVNEDVFECKMYITDLETNKNSKEINVSDLVFNDWIEFEFGDYEDEDYGTLPYKDFKFFINDYSVTFYSPQYQKAIKEIERLNNIIKEVREKLYDLNYKIKEIHNVPFDISEIFEMIEILDKVSDK